MKLPYIGIATKNCAKPIKKIQPSRCVIWIESGNTDTPWFISLYPDVVSPIKNFKAALDIFWDQMFTTEKNETKRI